MKNQKAKICFVATEINFFLTFFFELTQQISTKYEIALITDVSNANPGDKKKLEDINIKVIPLKKRKKSATLIEFLRFILALRKKINKYAPDYIFFLTLEVSMFGALISRFTNVKKIFFLITGFGPFFLKNNLKAKLFRAINKSSYFFLKFKQNYKFIFQNHDDMNFFLQKKISNKSNSVLLNRGLGININKFPYIERNSEKEITFLFAARLVKSKGFNEFLKAGKILLKKYPKIKIIVAGKLDFENPESISKNTYDDLMSSAINYIGEIRPKDMNDLYKKATIFVLPSYREGFAQGALEAASSGMPLILSNTSGCRECVINNTNGYLINTHDTNDIINKMKLFIINPEIIKPMSISSRKMIELNYSVKQITEDYLSLI